MPTGIPSVQAAKPNAHHGCLDKTSRGPSATPCIDDSRPACAAIRARIDATVVRRAPQVMVKVTGGGRGMKAIAAYFRYISKNGRLDVEDDRGDISRGKSALHGLAEDWRYGGTFIDDIGDRREAYNVMLSMPEGTDPLALQPAAREFAKVEIADHKHVMVLHDHQANPHVHVSVRAESRHGKRLNPRKADLHRWRETSAEKLRDQGIEAEATRQATRGRDRYNDTLWRLKARQDGRLRTTRPGSKATATAPAARKQQPSRGDAGRGQSPQDWHQTGTRVGRKTKKSAGANLLTLVFLGSPTWARTRDLRINSPALYRLSYRGTALNYSGVSPASLAELRATSPAPPTRAGSWREWERGTRGRTAWATPSSLACPAGCRRRRAR